MRSRQQLLRALVTDIIADIDEDAREVILTVHWRGGQHSQLRVRKPKSGEHGCRTPEEALAVMRSMASRWSETPRRPHPEKCALRGLGRRSRALGGDCVAD